MHITNWPKWHTTGTVGVWAVLVVEIIALTSQSIQLLGPLCLWQCLSIVLVICFVQFKEALKVHRTLMPIKSFQKLPKCLLIRFALQFCFPLSCFMQHVCNTTQYEMWDLILKSIFSIPSNSSKGIWCQEMIIASKKHRKNCECCPGHYLIVNHYSSMSWFKFRNLSEMVNCFTNSLNHS